MGRITLLLSALSVWAALPASSVPAVEPKADQGATIIRLKAKGVKGGVSTLAFSPSGRWLVAGTFDGFVLRWDLQKPDEPVRVQAHKEAVYSVAYSPDGKTFATAGVDRVIALWDAKTCEKLRVLEGHKETIACLAFSPDGKMLASASHDKTIRLWNLNTGQAQELQGHKERVTGVVFSPNGKSLVSGGVCRELIPLNNGGMFRGVQTDSLRIWDQFNAQQVRSLPFRGAWLSFSADGSHGLAGGLVTTGKPAEGRQVLIAGIGCIELIDMYSESSCLTLRGKGFRATFAPDGRTFATGGWGGSEYYRIGAVIGGGDPQQDGRLRIWETVTRKQIAILSQASYDVFAFSPSGTFIAAPGKKQRDGFGVDLISVGQANRGASDKTSVNESWEGLGASDPEKAYKAVYSLVSEGERAVKFLAAELKALPLADAKEVEERLIKLTDKSFSVRKAAAEELRKRAAAFEPALRLELGKCKLTDKRKALLDLINEVTKTVPDNDILQSMRAIQVLERIGSDGAARVLEKVASGAPGARLTVDAAAARKRIAARAGQP